MYLPYLTLLHVPALFDPVNPAYLAIFLHDFTSGWGKTPHR